MMPYKYYVTPGGEIIIDFEDEVCRVSGIQNETWFAHETIYENKKGAI